MLLSTIRNRLVLTQPTNPSIVVSWTIPKREIKIWNPEIPPENVCQPTKNRLPVVPPMPTEWMNIGMKTPKGTHEQWRFYGEEKTHNNLILGQFGIIAISAGAMKRNHFEFIRNKFNRYLETKSSFAIFRIDAPYKPKTSGGGKRMGGGKGNVKSYITPIKAGRVICEVGGKVTWEETRPWMSRIAACLPMECIAVSADMLERLRAEEQRLAEENTNPYTLEWMIRNNIGNCQTFLSPYDIKWQGKFTYRDRHNNKMYNEVLQSKYGRK